MRKSFKHHKQAQTPAIHLDTKKCKACWKCLEVCPKKVIGKVNIPWHKHARIINGSKCIGCLKCVKSCEFNAFSEILTIKNSKD